MATSEAVAQLERDMEAWVARCEAAVAAASEPGPPRKKSKSGKAGKPQPPAPPAACAERDALMGEIAGLIEEYELNKGEPLWVPEGTVEPTAVLPKNWAQYFAMRHAPTDDKAVRGLMTDSLCFPLTAIHALELALLGTTNTAGATTGDNMGGSSSSGGKALAGALKRDKLVIHLLGAEEAECNGLDKWGELLQMFPGVKACTLVMVGPEIDEELDGVMQVGSVGEEEEKKKKKKGKGGEGKAEHKEQQPVGEREYSVVFQRMAYHEFREAVTAEEDGGDGSDSDLAAAPDLVLAFNSGIADYREEWAPTMELLLEMGVPCCFTSYHSVEADFDMRTLRDVFEASVLVAAKVNPFKSTLPHEDVVSPEKSFYANGYITLFRGRSQR